MTTQQTPSPWVTLDPTRSLRVRRDAIASVSWDRRHYMNGSDSWLVVRMCDGTEYRIPSAHVDTLAVEHDILHGVPG